METKLNCGAESSGVTENISLCSHRKQSPARRKELVCFAPDTRAVPGRSRSSPCSTGQRWEPGGAPAEAPICTGSLCRVARDASVPDPLSPLSQLTGTIPRGMHREQLAVERAAVSPVGWDTGSPWIPHLRSCVLSQGCPRSRDQPRIPWPRCDDSAGSDLFFPHRERWEL